MKKILTILAIVMPLSLIAQDRSVKLNVKITADTGESLEGQKVTLRQTEYDVSYGTLRLNADGMLSLKVYPGQHRLSVERAGYDVLDETFTLTDAETERDVEYTLRETVTQPYALTTTTEHNAYIGTNSVHVTWNRQQPSFFDDFESYEPFSVQFGAWTGFDLDNEAAAALVGIYPNRGVMQYAQIINPLTVQPAWWYEYPILRPYSGKQYVGFTRTSSGNANNDWLVSPVISVGQHNVLSFLAKAADQYPERFMVYVTDKTANPSTEDFVRIDEGNYETADYTGWRECVYKLDDYAGKDIRFAIRYISEYNRYGSFMLMVDDVYVGQSMSDADINPNEQFKVYLDGTLVATTSDTEYTIEDISTGTHVISVQAVYTRSESQPTETTIVVSSDEYAQVTFNVEADSQLTTDGLQLQLTETTTAQTYTLSVADGKAVMASLPLGTYLLRIEEGAFVEYENTVVVTGDMAVKVALDDNVITPYNITADLQTTDGKTNAVLRWNQLLTFSDDFESYDNFATGEFGGWKTLDLDQMPVYPIGLGGINPDNIVNFPGASTYYDRKALAPLVFNPWQTSPAMLPTDPAIEALSGEKQILFFSPAQHKADKWLISPPVKIYANYVVEASMKSYDGSYLESVDFCVSTEGDNPDDFKAITSADYIPAGMWTLYQSDLAEYEGQTVRIGVHYKSYDTFMLQLDNFMIGPADGDTPQESYGNVVRYDIYLDGTLCGSSAEPTFTLTDIPAGTHTIGVVAVYLATQSPMATYELTTTTGIETVEQYGNSHAADTDAQWSLDGVRMPKITTGSHQPVIVRQGGHTYKVLK